MHLIDLARDAGIDLRADTLWLDESGVDFQVGHAIDTGGTRWILRVPRRAEVRERAASEKAALELLRRRFPVAVPEWRVATDELIAYPRLDGAPAATISPEAGGYAFRFDPSDPPANFIGSLGRAVAALHAVDQTAVAAAGLPVRTPAEVRGATRRRMERAIERLRVPPNVVDRWHRWLGDDSLWPETTVPVHGDLHPAHILVDDEHRVTGLLDWTEMAIDDPAIDFTIQYASLGEDALDRLLAAYASAGGEVRSGMRQHIIESWAAYPCRVVEFAEVSGEESYLHFAQTLVDQAATSANG